MASDKEFVDYVAEQIGLGSRLTYRKMFGEYAVYLDAKVVALICDNSLFIKPSQAANHVRQSCPNARPTQARRIIPWRTSCSMTPTRCAA